MNYDRLSPGLFKRDNYIYAFGGDEESVERYLINTNDWTEV